MTGNNLAISVFSAKFSASTISHSCFSIHHLPQPLRRCIFYLRLSCVEHSTQNGKNKSKNKDLESHLTPRHVVTTCRGMSRPENEDTKHKLGKQSKLVRIASSWGNIIDQKTKKQEAMSSQRAWHIQAKHDNCHHQGPRRKHRPTLEAVEAALLFLLADGVHALL